MNSRGSRAISAVAVAVAVLIPYVALATPKAGQPAPPFALPTVDGKTLMLSSLKGKAVYLNFFATWCPPCNEEAPFIGKLSERYKGRGLTVVGVNEFEDTQKTKEFLNKYSLQYSAVVDSDGKAGRDYGALGLPVHVFIDRSGVVSTYRLGEMSRVEIEAAIKKILR